MTVLPIIEVGDPVLRERAQAVTDVADPGFQRFVDDLIETMRDAGGAGLAANQVGDLRRVFVMEVGEHHPRYPYKPPIPLTVAINPELEFIGDDVITVNEGCLSVPQLRGELDRHAVVRMRYLDRDGAPQVGEFRGLTAGTVQHETDHLDGVLFLDRVSDPRTFTTWRALGDAFTPRAQAIVERYGG